MCALATTTAVALATASAAGEPDRLRAEAAPARSAAVGLRILRLVDPKRRIALPDGRSVPRTLVTEVRYPALGAQGGEELRDATPAPSAPLPLVVFAHGYAVEPGTYARLLRAWASAGYVVAAPVFPRTSARAPGGPDRSDLPNQPADLRLVISKLLSAVRKGREPWAALIDGSHIAVAGHSDGGITALAAAYDRGERDPRIGAAVILAGAWLDNRRWMAPATGGPALLGVQGTADHTNLPSNASEYFRLAAAPKYLVWLLGAGHLPPYTREQPQLGIVERATTAFLDRYLKGREPAERRLLRAGRTPGAARIVARP